MRGGFVEGGGDKSACSSGSRCEGGLSNAEAIKCRGYDQNG